MTDREAHTPSVGGYCDSEIYLQCSCGWEEFSSSSKTWDEHLIAAGVTLTPSLDEGLNVSRDQLTRWHEALVMANIPNPDKYPEDAEAHLRALDEIAAALAQEGETPT